MVRQDAAHEIAGSCLAFRIRVINRALTRLYDEALRDFGVTVAQVNLLVATTVRGPLRATDLGALLSIERSTLSRNLERLRSLGLVEDVPGDDGRSQPLRTTAAGRKLLDRMLPTWRKAQAEAEDLLGSSLASRLDGALRRVRQR